VIRANRLYVDTHTHTHTYIYIILIILYLILYILILTVRAESLKCLRTNNLFPKYFHWYQECLQL
jgi:hypothetical protein